MKDNNFQAYCKNFLRMHIKNLNKKYNIDITEEDYYGNNLNNINIKHLQQLEKLIKSKKPYSEILDVVLEIERLKKN